MSWILDLFRISPTKALELRDYVSIFSAFLVIATFSIDRIIARNTRKKEFLRTWYYKALFEPNLDKIETFYKDTLALFVSGYRKLKTAPKEKIPNLKSKLNSSFYDKKRNFDFEIIALLQQCIPTIEIRLMYHMQDLEDGFVNKIDAFNSPNDLEFEFRKDLMNHKSIFYILIYESLQNPNPSIWKKLVVSIQNFWKKLISLIVSFCVLIKEKIYKIKL